MSASIKKIPLNFKEQKLYDRIMQIVNSNKPGHVTYNGVHKWISKEMIHKIKNMSKEQEKIDGILPLLGLLAIIFGAITAAGTVAGSTAGIVTSVQQKKENERHNAEMENIARENSGNKEGGCLCETESDDDDKVINKIKDAIILLQSVGLNFD